MNRTKLHLSFSILLISAIGNYSFAQVFQLNGDAVELGGDCYQLTASTGNQNGTAWAIDQIDLSQPFAIDLDMQFGTNDNNGADGMVFVIQDVGINAVGDNGGGMGYSGFSPSIGVEFDTWQNTNRADPSYDHIALVTNGNVNHNAVTNIAGPVQADVNSINIEDGENHDVRFQWNPVSNRFQVYFDCELRIDVLYDLENVFSTPLAWWGFTGATGGAWNSQSICVDSNAITSGPNLTICNGASVLLGVTGDPEGNFTWSPANSLDDASIQFPTATPTETTEYIVNYSSCGIYLVDTVLVSVEELEINIGDPETLDCDDTTTPLFASSNFNSALSYDWYTIDGNIYQGGSSQQINVDAPGTYIVNVNQDSLCFATDSVIVIGDFDFVLTAEALEELLNCNHDETDIDADTNYQFGVDYTWSTDDGTIDTDPNNDEITVSTGGTYQIVAYLNELCNDSITVEITEDFTVYDIDAGPVMLLNCDIDQVELLGTTTATDGITIWSTSDGNIVSGFTTLTPDIDEAGTYSVLIINPTSGCESTDEVQVLADFTIPEVIAGYADTLTCRENMGHILGASHNVDNATIAWTTPDGNILSGWTDISPHVNQPGTYMITVTNLDNGCENSDMMQVSVDDNYDLDLSQLTIPNVISPGTDNKNDYFRMFLANDPQFDVSAVMEEFSLQVYDRWGNLIYTSDGHVRSWDGRVSGEIPSSGTYYYTLNYEVECGVVLKETVEGTLELLAD